MKIALAQFNPVVGDIAGNTLRMAEFIDRAAVEGADLVVFGELSVVGYPPRDLLRKDGLVAESVQAVERLAKACTRTAALVGFVRPAPTPVGHRLENVAAYLAEGQVRYVHVKQLLPTYDVFDETRYFEPGKDLRTIQCAGRKIGISICEDLWDPEALGRPIYPHDPIARLVEAGAEVIVNLAASPFEMGKPVRREEMFHRRADRSGVPIVYVNQVGGNDELIFDGCSSVVAPGGRLLGRSKSFEEDLLVADLRTSRPGRCEPLGDDLAQLSAALKLGLRDYTRKCGFSRVVLGLSGGVDSAVVAVLAADAIGPENVTALAMPSRYSSDHSLADARSLAQNLGADYHEIPIERLHAAYEQVMREAFFRDGEINDVAAENVQARIRGNLVMAWSNAFGHLPLATGNKSELSVGYCTLYGDMCGGLAPIGDVLKTQVYELARRLNDERAAPCIPESTFRKPPSAELKSGQVDQDKLPPYDVLDAILRQYVEEDRTADEILDNCDDARITPELVRQAARMVDLAEYKRQQAARVLKVSPRAFGMGRRVPIAQRFIQRRSS